VCLLVLRSPAHLKTNNTNSLLVALSMIIYVCRTQSLLWEHLSVAEICGALGHIRHISTNLHIQIENVPYNTIRREF